MAASESTDEHLRRVVGVTPHQCDAVEQRSTRDAGRAADAPVERILLRAITTVLFDLGGVLTNDPWQALLLSPSIGVADQLGLDRQRVESAGERLWSSYSLRIRHECEYWRDFAREVGVILPANLVRQVERDVLQSNERAGQAFQLLDSMNISWGYITDNTAFWLPKQIARLGGKTPATADLAYYSFQRQLSKESKPIGLFDVAARVLEPSVTLLVEDREANIVRAGSIGFQLLPYSIYETTDLVEALETRLT